jgi:hypothetical protein
MPFYHAVARKARNDGTLRRGAAQLYRAKRACEQKTTVRSNPGGLEPDCFPPWERLMFPTTFTCDNHAFGSSGQHLWQPLGYCRILPKCNGTEDNRPATAPTLAKFAG